MTRAALLLLCVPACCAWAAAAPEHLSPVPNGRPDQNSVAGLPGAARDAGYVLAVAEAHEAAWERYQALHGPSGRDDNGLCR